MRVTHRHTQTGPQQHRHVVGHVAERHHLRVGNSKRPGNLVDTGGLADTERHDLHQPVIGRVGDIALETDMLSQFGGHVGTGSTGFTDQQFDRRRAEQVVDRHFGVVRIQPRMLVARRADELGGRRVVCALADPLDRQSRTRYDAGRNFGQRCQGVDGQGAHRHHPIGPGVVDDGAVGAHRHRREAEGIDDGSHPARRPAGGQDEVRAGVYRGMHRVASAFGDGFSVIEQGSVDVTRDERRHSRFQSWLACQCGPTWLRRDEVTPSYPRFCRRFANSAILSCLDSSTVGAPPPSRRGTQCSPLGCGYSSCTR
ncbi:Uncharacterised protein [Mycobacterium tuberculosis]|uniref:Uncharacterized protein n=1 Tax=Mycobacterium tuberculosis TaxID=1773 RepID=A0A654TRJ9_MYCTX|nr:Uncharacterised protein [Mycobacterium tuberculosis]CKS61440.1 Uncharacterised protein [Mycobacterium tuberculosis]